MIELRDLRKSYQTGTFVQKALDGVTLNFRGNEFVAVLGPSGSGKTTLLNVLGGLDRADSGDIVVNGVSTKDYSGKDWDTYRNHRIGFIFQSYNLIPHQSVLSNVELALTLGGVPRQERKARATKALEQVGLAEHVHKKPSQLSGGQMQRVAIARALVNNPDIVLADEPTGALDTETGIQVMNLLKGIAMDRLVIMVTHNPDLANAYATRIVSLSDGRIVGDSNPFYPAAGDEGAADAQENGALGVLPVDASAAATGQEGKEGLESQATAELPSVNDRKSQKKHASMSFLTALGLSFNNLMTKKGRTFMTAFAGSIGILGIAAILALSNGVNNYIEKTEEDALSSYPLTVTKSSFNLLSLMGASDDESGDSEDDAQGYDSLFASDDEQVESSSLIPSSTIMSDMFAQVKNNDLATFKEFLDGGGNGIGECVNAIQYDYGVSPIIYKSDTSQGIVQLNPSSFLSTLQNGVMGSALTGSSGTSSFSEMMDDRELIESQMDVVAGRWPESYDECVLVLSSDGSLTDYTLYALGVYDTGEMNDMMQEMLSGDEVVVPEVEETFTYEDALNTTFKVVPASSLYSKNEELGTWTDMSSNDEYMTQLISESLDLKVVGIVQPSPTASTTALSEGVAYTHELTEWLISQAADSEIVKQQLADESVDVFTGKTFEELQSEGGSDLDFSSIISVDESAFANAFSFDASALENMEIGELDLSGMDISGLASSMDTSSLDIDLSSLSAALDADSITSILQNAPTPDFSSLSSSITVEQASSAQTIASNIAAGFLPYWYSQHPDESITPQTDMTEDMEAYLATEEVQEQQAQLTAIVGAAYGTALQEIVEGYMQDQFMPYFQDAMQQMLEQAAASMAEQMQDAIASQVEIMVASMSEQLSSAISQQLQGQMSTIQEALAGAVTVDASAIGDAIQFNMSQDDLTSLLTNYMYATDLTFDANIETLGYADDSDPQSISIYPKDFAAKEEVLRIIDAYNADMKAQGRDDDTISYSDIAGTLMSSVTDIIDKITMVLIAFVSISLVVSSIMIGIITYISVLERKKEIGILRAMGASKMNIANVFNAETVIEGLIAGLMAVIAVGLASIPVNIIVEAGFQIPNIMSLPIQAAAALVAISVGLTLIAGLIPSSAASKRDPVEALRSE